MKPFRQTALRVAVMSLLRLALSIKQRYAHWIPALVFVLLSATVVGSLHAERISPRRLLEVTDLGNPVISPDGRYVAFRSERASIGRNKYDTTWYIQALNGKSLPLRVGNGGTPLRQYNAGLVLPSPAVWSPDEKWIYYRARLDGRVSDRKSVV